MTKQQVDEYFTNNWDHLVSRAQSIHRNLSGRGSHNDLVQDAYIHLLDKSNNLTTYNDAEAFFTRFVSSQIRWTESNHNREQTHCIRTTMSLKEKGITIPVQDIFGRDDDFMEKLEIENDNAEMKGYLEIYKQKSAYNRIFTNIFMEYLGNTRSMSERLNISIHNIRRMVRSMKNNLVHIKYGMREENFLVAGCGPSISNIRDKSIPATVIGVNDVARYLPIDYHVVIDPLKHFDYRRKKIIENTKSNMLYTHLTEKQVSTKAPVTKIDFHPKRGFEIPGDKMPKSNHSTFVAACLAVRMGADSIAFCGMDIIGHPNWKQKRKMDATRAHLRDFCTYCDGKGIKLYNLGSEDNILEGMPGVVHITYDRWSELMKINYLVK